MGDIGEIDRDAWQPLDRSIENSLHRKKVPGYRQKNKKPC